MAKAEQIVELLKSHISGDDSRFFAIAMQVAAHEAQQGHSKLAQDLKELIDKAKENVSAFKTQSSVISFLQPKGELANLLSAEYSNITFAQLSFSDKLLERFERIIIEQRQQQTLLKHGLKPRRKILLYGPPGTGKTITASALAGELKLPLFTIRLDGLITKYMGETASKLRLVFDAMKITRAVYLFDEFDAIGGDRNMGNDVGEIRRILNSFLQFMEQDQSDSLILAATNYVQLLDTALFRRFDDVIEYNLPDRNQIERVIRNRLFNFKLRSITWDKLCAEAEGLNHAEIVRACSEAAKRTVLAKLVTISEKFLLDAIKERRIADMQHKN
jgi:SpoVK/Ycf46/Vps4 family AAA+-type ATPase